MSTEILGYFLETGFVLVFADMFRPRGDGNSRFSSGNNFPFLVFFSLYIGLFQRSLFLIYLCRYRTAKYVVIAQFCRTHTMSMLHYLKSHIILERFFFTASINVFYYFPFLQSIDRWHIAINSCYFFKRDISVCSSFTSFNLNVTCLKFRF